MIGCDAGLPTLFCRIEVLRSAQISPMRVTKGRPNHDQDHLRFLSSSRSTTFKFRGTPECRIRRPFYTVEHRENAKILHLICVIKCRFDATSDAKLFWIIMVVVVARPSLSDVRKSAVQGHFRGACLNPPCSKDAAALVFCQFLILMGFSPIKICFPRV